MLQIWRNRQKYTHSFSCLWTVLIASFFLELTHVFDCAQSKPYAKAPWPEKEAQNRSGHPSCIGLCLHLGLHKFNFQKIREPQVSRRNMFSLPVKQKARLINVIAPPQAATLGEEGFPSDSSQMLHLISLSTEHLLVHLDPSATCWCSVHPPTLKGVTGEWSDFYKEKLCFHWNAKHIHE